MKNNFRILRVIATMDPATGGPPSGIHSVTPFLKELEIETTIVSLDSGNEKFIKNSDLNIICLGKRKTPWQFHSKLKPWLIENLSNFQVVIVHGLWLYHGYAVRRAIDILVNRRQTVPKYYIIPHGMLDPYFQNTPLRKIKSFRNIFYWNIIEKKNISCANGILFTCQMELNLAKHSFKNYYPNNVYNLGYGVKTGKPSLKPISKSHLLFLGRFDPKKGIDLLVNAYNQIAILENQPLPKLIIAGPGLNEAYGKAIQKMVSKNKLLKTKIECMDLVQGQEKWDLIDGAKALILWSHQENFGIVVAEALSRNVPILLSEKVNISKEIIEDNSGLVGQDNLPELIKTLKIFLNLSEAEYNELSSNAGKTYINRFSPKQYAQNLKDLFIQ